MLYFYSFFFHSKLLFLNIDDNEYADTGGGCLSSGVTLFEIPVTRFLALNIILQLRKFSTISQDSRTLSWYLCFRERHKPVR